jgi:toxin ParE1/3/4
MKSKWRTTKRAAGLGRRYHAAFRSALLRVCEAPHRFKIVQAPGIRRVSLRGFPFSVIFREANGVVQVLAVAPHRKRPGYWTSRM